MADSVQTFPNVLATTTAFGGVTVPHIGRGLALDDGLPGAATLVVPMVAAPGQAPTPAAALSDAQPNVEPAAGLPFLGTVARATVFDGVNWQRVGGLIDAADAAPVAALPSLVGGVARTTGFNGASWDRVRTASAANVGAQSGQGALLATGPGEWSVSDRQTGGVGLVTVATRPAVPGARHVCRGLSCFVVDPTALSTQEFVLRDGLPGVGTVLWRGFTLGLTTIVISGLNIVGSVGTAMTLEAVGASLDATTITAATLIGYTAV